MYCTYMYLYIDPYVDNPACCMYLRHVHGITIFLVTPSSSPPLLPGLYLFAFIFFFFSILFLSFAFLLCFCSHGAREQGMCNFLKSDETGRYR